MRSPLFFSHSRPPCSPHKYRLDPAATASIMLPMATKTKQLSPRAAKIIGSLLIIVSVIALCFGGEQVVKGIEKSHTWNKEIATVTHLEPVRGKRGRVSYKACLSFRDAATNHSYSIKSQIASNPPSFQRGQKVEVLDPADNPENAVVNSFMEIYFWALIAGVMGLVMGFFGCALSFGKQSKAEPDPEAPAES